MRIASIDFETFSRADLPKVGHYRYAEDESTEILLCAYRRAEWDAVRLWSPAEGEPLPDDLADIFQDHETLINAWNAAFERAITANCLPQFDVPVTRWRCSMVDAMAAGLPGKLAQAGPAAGLPEELFKQEGGTRLINRFCKPRKATKKNTATRWTPETSPVEWQMFKDYCRQDVTAEMAIYDKLKNWHLPEDEQDLWELDQRINDHGIRVDLDLVHAAHKMGLAHREYLVEKAKALTGLDNPNSVKQLIDWLNDQPDFDPDEDAEVEDLRKKTVEKILGRDDLDSIVRQVLELRQQIAKSSLKKYDVLIRATCRDGYIRGTMQFYGANRTGRWAGRMLQVQNLPQGMIEDLKELRLVRELVRNGEYETLCLMYGEDQIPNVLATLIRTCLIASPGNDLLAVDFSAIESVVTAWFADCQWRMEVFKTHGKIYEASAATAFGMSLDDILGYKKRTGKHHPIRKKGKVIELACLAGNTKVLTPRGYIDLINVTTNDRVWDGTQWVEHKGLIYRGEKETINVLGVRVTPDHLIRTQETWTPAGTLASSESTRSLALETGSASLPYSAPFARNTAPVSRTSSGSNAPVGLNPMRYISTICGRVFRPGAMLALKSKQATGSRPISNTLTSARMMHTVGAFLIGSAPASSVATRRMPGSTGTMAVGESMYSTPGAGISGHSLRILSVLVDGINRILSSTGSTSTEAMSRATSASSPRLRTQGTSGSYPTSRQRLPVFDLLYCGPNNAFTILSRKGPLLVHNCGYGGSENAMINMGALEQGLVREELKPMVEAWRDASPEIAGTKNARGYRDGGIWATLEKAAKDCIRTQKRQEAGKCIFRYAGGKLVITLPSGRHLHYVRCRLERDDKGREQITYWGVDQKTKRWGKQKTWGGKLLENCLAGDTEVLTCSGWKPLLEVTTADRVWDGEAFVPHVGVKGMGIRETIGFGGVRVTPDHKVNINTNWIPAGETSYDAATESFKRHYRLPVREPGSDSVFPQQRSPSDMGRSLRLRGIDQDGSVGTIEGQTEVVRVPEIGADRAGEYETREVQTPGLRGVVVHEGALPADDTSRICPVWRPWNNGLSRVGRFLRKLLGGHGSDVPGGLDFGASEQRTGLLPGQLRLGEPESASQEHPEEHQHHYADGRDAPVARRGSIRDRQVDAPVPQVRGLEAREDVRQTRFHEPVFDILNAGPRHRFTVRGSDGRPFLVHNCVQAFSRDCLAVLMKKLRDLRYQQIMLVHDEDVMDVPKDFGSLEEVLGLMKEPIPWAPGLPLKGDGFRNDFYFKG